MLHWNFTKTVFGETDVFAISCSLTRKHLWGTGTSEWAPTAFWGEKQKSWRCLDLERRHGFCCREKINHRCQTAGVARCWTCKKRDFLGWAVEERCNVYWSMKQCNGWQKQKKSMCHSIKSLCLVISCYYIRQHRPRQTQRQSSREILTCMPLST